MALRSQTRRPAAYHPASDPRSVGSSLVSIMTSNGMNSALTIRRNYLQSPYFFMCCNLCDADLNRSGQLAAALQGDESETSAQSALAGTLVSSLHRLKDIDNSGTTLASISSARHILICRQMAASLFSRIFLSGLRENSAYASVSLKCSSESTCLV